MDEKIIYSIKDIAVNPDFVGVIVAPHSDSYIFEDPSEVPEEVRQITDHFRSGTPLDYALLDCTTHTTLATVNFSRIEGLNLMDSVFFFFCIVCEKETDAAFSIETISKQRLWINGKIAALCCTDRDTSRQLFTLTLSAGTNVICFQQHDSYSSFLTTVRFTPLEYENSLAHNSMVKNNFHYKKGEIAAEFDGIFLQRDEFQISCTPVDSVNLDLNEPVTLSIEDSITGEVMYSRKLRFFEYIRIDLSKIPFTKKSPFHHAHAVLRTRTRGGGEYAHSIDVFPVVPCDYMKQTEDRARRALEDPSISEHAAACLRYNLACIYHFPEDDIINFLAWEAFEREISMIERGEYDTYLQSPGAKKLYYFTHIDDQYMRYCICLPKGFDPEQRYALLIINTITSADGSMYSYYFERTDAFPDLIVADIHGRGMTTGSYVGDRSFREILADIEKRYRIDEDRIYAMGQSNGGYATWTLAEKSPVLFAGIYPSTGYLNPNEVRNLSNMRVRFLTSDADPGHIKNTEGVDAFRDCLKDYECTTFHKLMHNVFEQVQFEENALRELLSAKRDPWPDEVWLDTHMNRYGRAYWVSLHSIESGRIYAHIHARTDGDNIIAEAENTSSFALTLPPKLDPEKTHVLLNGRDYPPTGERERRFEMRGGDFAECEKFTENTAPYKGTGLVDGYIALMKTVNLCPESKILSDIANAIRLPRSNTYDGGEAASYSFIDRDADKLKDAEYLRGRSFAVVTKRPSEYTSDFAASVDRMLEIHTDADGYEYRGARTDGPYCVMQIARSPWSPTCSVLHVSTNDEETARKNVFTKRILLPSYINAFHPYYNSCAMIFDGHTYKRILDYGCGIEELSPRKNS